MTENSFGNFLKDKITNKQWSSTELAKKINEDSGAVRAWVRGDRVPCIGHECIKKIADIFFMDFEEVKNIQIQALTERKNSPKKYSKKLGEGKNLIDPLTRSVNPSEHQEIRDSRPDSDYGCIKGTKIIGETMISMLDKLSKEKDLANKEILLTFQSKDSIFNREKDLQNKWQNVQFNCIKNNFNITHLLRLDPNESKRTYEFVSSSLQFFEGTGKYNPMYLNSQKILLPSYGLFLLPEEGLILFTSQQPETMDAAIYTRDSEQLEILRNHYFQLKEQSTSIFKVYESYEQGDFVEELVNSDDEPGDRVILSRRLSEITRPTGWYNENHPWAKSLIKYLTETAPKDKKIDFSDHIDHRKKRAEKIESHLNQGKYICRYIYPRSCIKSFINNGCIQPHYFIPSKEERIEQLERMLDLLRYDQYEIALVEDTIYETIKPSFCEVQGNNTFIMEFLEGQDGELDKISKCKWLLAKDKVVVRSFQEYLSKIWNSIQETDKEKYRISEILRQGIKSLS
jgi:hypothetical protein